MSNQTFAKPKNKNSTSFSPVFGKKPKNRSFSGESNNAKHDLSNTSIGHNFGNIQGKNSQAFRDSCPLSLSNPSRCPYGGTCHTCASTIQAKLKIGKANDKYEQEADRVADQVMRMPELQAHMIAQVSGHVQGNQIQRMCTKCEEKEEEMQLKPLHDSITPLVQRQIEEEDEEEELLQTKKLSGQTHNVSQQVNKQIDSMRGSGQPLPESVRAFFWPRFGYDFSKVNLHYDSRASKTAKAVNAKAFTIGRDLVFGAGQYAPETPKGKRLLAHELTHVTQQRHVSPTIMPYRLKKGTVNYGAKDSSTLKEKEFNSNTPDPYIRKIKIEFNKTQTVDGESVPGGILSANYESNGAKPMPGNISGISILGGYPSEGLTDKVKDNALDRIEGYGYHHIAAPRNERVGSKWPEYKYFKPSKGGKASMSYALFFKDKQAIHLGGLNTGSLACVHVDALNTMRQLNYHSRIKYTKVDVTYTNSALKKPCCERYKVKKYMVSNPCKGQDPKEC